MGRFHGGGDRRPSPIDRSDVLRRGCVVLLVALAVVVTACSGSGADRSAPEPTARGIWAAAVAKVLADTPSDFHSKALADGWVSDEEYHQAQDLFTQCVADLGVAVEFSADPAEQGYTTHADDDPSVDVNAAEDQCGPSSIDGIQWLYHGMRANLQGLSAAQATRQCFEQHGLTDGSGLSDAEFTAEINGGTFSASTPEGALCVYDPFGQYGPTPEQAWQWQDGARQQNGGAVPPPVTPAA